ncbi:hypothetical protein [Sphingobium cloacae]|uniref:Uncharacterized protein n=1 Tax=Sphingobium cloacae TaxID=120107 RepID=A0A1E1F3L4_9SPHN|nr:hypothetical protein [Sphingobium cloacae]BAV65052.1 hypothetical protein SCLO_1020120 [Sphingobium cloacae]
MSLRPVAAAVVHRLRRFKIEIRITGGKLEFLVPAQGALGRPKANGEYAAGHDDGAARELMELIRELPALQQAIVELGADTMPEIRIEPGAIPPVDAMVRPEIRPNS